MTKFIKHREKEMSYHERFYNDATLFEPGTWLYKPVEAVLDLFQELDLHKEIRVLDLGCGVGRNSIPIAQRMQEAGGTVVCVDLLPVAIDKLRNYAKEYNVNNFIHAEVADAEFYEIKPDYFDYIIACSCLEHVSDITAFRSVIQRMIDGTRIEGVHCIQMSTEVTEFDIETGEEAEGEIELNLKADEAFQILSELYIDWEIIIQRKLPQRIYEQKGDREIEFKGQWITFSARKKV
ncbi:class I SAM-dependent methyltransferase [Paenibacillus apii]|uniref:class I SAM-dependent methyltransferase n=1 Tax=Paenibacillus apii TaxID=1850370 RepID=UPI00143B0BE5|nr:class I SAM-dependent methyltransferase [Paenibacillus apii]NJJ41538.1 class I SAM-dependent methyltransferase [Paenibacillus apii]